MKANPYIAGIAICILCTAIVVFILASVGASAILVIAVATYVSIIGATAVFIELRKRHSDEEDDI